MTSTQLRSRHAPAEPARGATARSSAVPPSGPGKVLFAFCLPEPELAQALAGRGIEVVSVSCASELGRCADDRSCILLDLDAPGADDAVRGWAERGVNEQRWVLLASASSVFLAMKYLAEGRAHDLLMKPASAAELQASLLASRAGSGRHLPSLERIQWEYIHAVLGSCDGNVSEAARQLGIYRQSLQRMLRRHPPHR